MIEWSDSQRPRGVGRQLTTIAMAVLASVGWSRQVSASGKVRAGAVLTLAIDPHTPTTLYAGTYWSGVLKSLDGGHNLQFPGTSCGATIPSLDPLLDPAGLQDNGGPRQTIALLPDSPAIGAGDPAVCADPPVDGVDQRGYARPGRGHTQCSIGAYEADAAPPCSGDCDRDGRVTVNEVLPMVDIALGVATVSDCQAGDARYDGTISIDEILTAVSSALNGCGG